jgi:hypothetical protein
MKDVHKRFPIYSRFMRFYPKEYRSKYEVGRQQFNYLGENMSKSDRQGKLAGLPYDLRRPTVDRYKSRFWDPTASLITPKAFGWGYTVNFYRLFHPFKRK